MCITKTAITAFCYHHFLPMGGQISHYFAITLNRPSALQVTVQFSTQDGPPPNGFVAPADYNPIVNLTVTWPVLRDKLDLAVTLHNLFDEHYADPPGPAFVQNAIEQDGRTVIFEASFRF